MFLYVVVSDWFVLFLVDFVECILYVVFVEKLVICIGVMVVVNSLKLLSML